MYICDIYDNDIDQLYYSVTFNWVAGLRDFINVICIFDVWFNLKCQES
jgi:hypothetical protein